MKMIVAHLAHEAFEPVRSDLLDLGVLRITICEVHSTGPQTQTTLRHKGVRVSLNSRPQLRLECIVAAGQAPCVVDVLRTHALACPGAGGQVVVIDLEELHPGTCQDRLYPGDPRADEAVR